jgi:hypothetical protein
MARSLSAFALCVGVCGDQKVRPGPAMVLLEAGFVLGVMV